VCKLKKLSNTKKESAGKDADGEPDPETTANGINGIADANGTTVEAQSPAVGGSKHPKKRKGLHARICLRLGSLPRSQHHMQRDVGTAAHAFAVYTTSACFSAYHGKKPRSG